MKQVTAIIILLMTSSILFSQSVKLIENMKDSWGTTYTYTGEVKNGKPDGMGVATYSSGNVVRYVGSFANGMYNGRGVMFFQSDAFLAGDWKNGKLNGKGTNLMESGSLYIGEFGNGIKNGRGVLFFSDNSVMIGNYLDDKVNGRSIKIWKEGNIISDCIYAGDKLNGTGYQYEAKDKKLFQGEWKDDQWVQAATPSFRSFLTATSLTGEITDSHVLIGPVNSNNFLTDSGYYYNLEQHKRFFGWYSNGNLKDGFVIREDSTRFLGKMDDNGATGYCYDYKVKKFYSEGNFTNDLLNGRVLDIDLGNKSVYMGDVANGVYTGKAYFFNGKGTMYSGDYDKGRFTGYGSRMQTDGRYMTGTWEEGTIKKLVTTVTPRGEIISGTPKTFAEGLNTAIKAYPDIFDDIYGGNADDDMSGIDPDDDLEFTESLVDIPGSVSKNLIAEDYDENTFYYARFLETDNFTKAKAKYNELATQLQSAVISNAYITGKQKLVGKITPPDASGKKTVSMFAISGNTKEYEDFQVWLRIRKDDDDRYTVEILLGEKEDDY